jgi:hypothetical protein
MCVHLECLCGCIWIFIVCGCPFVGVIRCYYIDFNCMYMCICTYVLRIVLYVYVHLECLCGCIWISFYVFVYVCECMFCIALYAHVYVFECLHACVFGFLFLYMCFCYIDFDCMYVYLCVSNGFCIHICILNVFVCMCIWISLFAYVDVYI